MLRRITKTFASVSSSSIANSSLSVSPSPTNLTSPALNEISSIATNKISKVRRTKVEDIPSVFQQSKVFAYCWARQYNLHYIENYIKQYPQLYSMNYQNRSSSEFIHVAVKDQNGDLFFFKDGCMISWNTNPSFDQSILREIREAEVDTLDNEVKDDDEMNVINDPYSITGMKGDDIYLSTNRSQIDLFYARLAFSHGLARSCQLAVLEKHLDKFLASIEHFPKFMIENGRHPSLSRAEVTRKHGELLYIRGLLNLHSDLVDSLPDLYWSKQTSAIHFQSISKALDIVPRIRILNQRLDYAAQLVGLMKDRQSEIHGSRMEYIIIALIFVEVVFETIHYLNELNYVNLKSFAYVPEYNESEITQE